MNLILNIIWLICGGLVTAAGWVVAGLLMAITIVGLPWTPAAFRIALYTLLPFGQQVIERPTGPVSFIGNVIWFILAGWWLALLHLIAALFLAVTIIGLPFAWAHVKLARLSLAPVGTLIVPNT